MDNIIDKKKAYLDRNIFFGLKNLNTGFDAVGIKYFSEKDFEIVLNRVKQHGLGIKGIEPWKNGEFYQVLTYEEFTNDCTEPKWYMKAFESFKEDREDLQYAATYYIPEKLFSDED